MSDDSRLIKTWLAVGFAVIWGLFMGSFLNDLHRQVGDTPAVLWFLIFLLFSPSIAALAGRGMLAMATQGGKDWESIAVRERDEFRRLIREIEDDREAERQRQLAEQAAIREAREANELAVLQAVAQEKQQMEEQEQQRQREQRAEQMRRDRSDAQIDAMLAEHRITLTETGMSDADIEKELAKIRSDIERASSDSV